MPLSPKAFLTKAETIPIIDVRSPAEFAYGYIPNAHNIPLFSNEERAKVGTCYKKVGKDAAVLLGLEIVGPKLANFVKEAKKLAPNNELLVHCWRGGMRSGSFAWLLETAGMQVSTLAGGYKAYRNLILSALDAPPPLLILGGKTGSGKTEILQALAQKGEQVIDLEGLANHKGSAFGALGQAPQPSSEMFENLLYEQWKTLDPLKPLWLEDESKNIGSVHIPNVLFARMREAKTIFIAVDFEARVQFLVQEYAIFETDFLKTAIDHIAKRLGGQHHQAALKALEEKDFATVAKITLVYYDKAYLHGLAKRTSSTMLPFVFPTINPEANAQALLDWVKTKETSNKQASKS